MRRKLPAILLTAGILATPLATDLSGNPASRLYAKEKVQPVAPDDATLRLFQLLDASREGKLADFYVLADIYKDPKNPGEELQHILRAEYDKSHLFGKFKLYVRAVAKLTPEQLKTYTPKQIYEFGEADAEKFSKIEPGAFGRPGDVYFQAEGNRPLTSAPITDDVRKTYELLLTQYLMPALQKK